MGSRDRRLVSALGWVLCLLALGMTGSQAWAHPMGNFSVNHYARIELGPGDVRVHYFIDLAEIPTYQQLQQADVEPGPGASINAGSPAMVRLIAGRGAELGRGLRLSIDGRAVSLRTVSSGAILPPGAGGLPTMKMGFVYAAEYPAGMSREHVRVEYADGNYPGQSGWKEIVAVCPGCRMEASTAPSSDRSGELTNYPTDLLQSPPQALTATVEATLAGSRSGTDPDRASAQRESAVGRDSAPGRVGVGGASVAAGLERKSELARETGLQPNAGRTGPAGSAEATGAKRNSGSAQKFAAEPNAERPVMAAAQEPVALRANRQQTPRSRFTELITEQHLSLWFLVTAALIAMGLGGLHALEPGHGKTIVAAYLVGSRGTAGHAVLLGLIVTAAHTAGVFALGAVTLYASRYVVPEQLYPWLGVLSGITIATLGGWMFLARWTGAAAEHSHADGDGHWPFARRRKDTAGGAAPTAAAPGAGRVGIGLVRLFTLGITGGIIPCPAALIVLLSAFALHRVGLGFFLIVAFSAGLAAVLIGFGLAMVYARRWMAHLAIDGLLTKRWLPLASSAFIAILGMGVAWQGLPAAHLSFPELSSLFTKERVGPLLFVTGLGLILGMRHSTDADHVVAISTIVSRQRSIRNAALIGSIWGLGHTITVFAVGSVIILFGVEIPPRIGLSMEFSVALMLILLGVLNLTGVMQRITERLTGARRKSNSLAEASKPARPRVESAVAGFGWYQCIRPLVVGLVHGLAGSAAVALLVLSTIHNPYWAMVYLVIFGLGTLLGMMCMTAAIAVPLTYAGDRFAGLSRSFAILSGMVSVCFGSFLVYQLGYLGGLFTSHPQWTPQ